MKLWTWLAAALLAVPALAHAQGTYDSGNEPTDKKYDVQLQGGIGGWTGAAAGETTNVGPSYGVIGAYNQTPWLSYELGYQGNSNALDTGGGRLTANRIQADLKAGPQMAGPIAWRPYVFAGVAADFVHAGQSLSGFDSSFQGEIPMGAGADLFTNLPVRVGARGTFDFNPGVGGSLSPVSEHPSAWQAALTASAVF